MSLPPKITPFSATPDIRYVGGIAGRYTFPDALEHSVYSCRTASLSPTAVVIAAAVKSVPGDRVGLRLDHLGLLNGTLVQVLPDGFRIELGGSQSERSKLAAKINWLKKRSLRQAEDKRLGTRFQPKNPKGHLSIAGVEVECFIIDLSVSGAALSAGITPPIGSAVSLGRIEGRVVRHMEGGFGMQFSQPLAAADVEAEATAIRSPASDDHASPAASASSLPGSPASR